jgi:hypothetical protein
MQRVSVVIRRRLLLDNFRGRGSHHAPMQSSILSAEACALQSATRQSAICAAVVGTAFGLSTLRVLASALGRRARLAVVLLCVRRADRLLSWQPGEPALVMREASDRPRARPVRASGHRPRTSVQCASARESPRSTPTPDPPRQRPDQRERRSARHGAGRRYVGRAPTASGLGHRPAGRDRLIPAVPRAARTFPRARQPPNQRPPGVPLANPHGANRNAQPETGPARRPPRQLPAQTREHLGAAVRHPRPDRSALRWRAVAQTAAACAVHHRSLYPTRPASSTPTTSINHRKSQSHGHTRRPAQRPPRRPAEVRTATTAVIGYRQAGDNLMARRSSRSAPAPGNRSSLGPIARGMPTDGPGDRSNLEAGQSLSWWRSDRQAPSLPDELCVA